MAVPACCINKASGTGPPRHDETGPLALWRHSYPSPPAETIRVNLRSSAHPGPAVNPSPSPGRPARPPSGLRRAAGVRPAAGCPMTRLAFSATFSAGDLFARGNPVESPGEIGLRLEGASSFHAATRPRRRAFSLRTRVLGRRGSGHGAAGPSGQRTPQRSRVRWLPDDRLGGRIAGRGVQVAPHGSGRGRFTRGRNPLPRWRPRGFDRVPCPPATLSEMAGEGRARHRPPRNRPCCHRAGRSVSEPAMSIFFG
jgi:hypothetical protein